MSHQCQTHVTHVTREISHSGTCVTSACACAVLAPRGRGPARVAGSDDRESRMTNVHHVSYSLLRSAVHAGTRQRISPCQTHDTHLHQLAAHTTARRQIQIHTTASHSGLPVRWRCCAVQYQLPSQELYKSQVQHAEGRYREHALLFCAPFALANGAIVCLSCHRLSMSPSSSTQPSPARTDPTAPAWWAAAF